MLLTQQRRTRRAGTQRGNQAPRSSATELNYELAQTTKHQARREEERTCLTDSAISGPMPSPGKRVARIGAWEQKALATDDRRELELELELGLRWLDERIWLERLPIARFRIWEAIRFSSFCSNKHRMRRKQKKKKTLKFKTQMKVEEEKSFWESRGESRISLRSRERSQELRNHACPEGAVW